MKKLTALLLCLILVCSLAACGGKATDSGSEAVFRELYSSELTTLNYLLSGNTSDHAIGANCVDTLVEYDNYGEMLPSLATEWKTSDDGLTWTFTLRSGVKWYDYQGNEVADVTAQDFVDAAKYALNAEYESECNSPLFAIKNAEAYYNYLAYIATSDNGTKTVDDEGNAIEPVAAMDWSEVGIKAIDASTLEYTLESVTPYFLSMLTYVCYMPAYGPQLEELGKDFATSNDKMYYCGAYIMTDYEPQVKHVLTKNANNWDADKVYIDRIEETYNTEASITGPEMVLRGDIDFATISSDLVDEWMTNHADYISQRREKVDYSYFYSFNYDPQFDAEYEPDNWAKAVLSENFRKSIVSAFDRLYSLTALDSNNQEGMLQQSVTPATFVGNEGKDYTEYGSGFDGLTVFDAAAAVKYRDEAITELSYYGVTFPVKVPVMYRPDDSGWTNETILLEQQIESVLGTDYIDIIPVAGPTENFLSQTRRAGNYAFMKTNWGADYQDPETWTDPFTADNNYQFMDTVKASDGQLQSDFAALVSEYYAMVDAAKAETSDINARYELFAKAEQFMISHAIVVPYATSVVEYQATRLNVYEGQYASFGVSMLRYKGQHLLDDYVSMDDLAAEKADWESKKA